MIKFIYILSFLLFANNLFSQVIDTCYVLDTTVYHVNNQQENSFLYWDVTGGEIISENPSKTDSIVILWNTVGIYELSVYEKTKENCSGQNSFAEILVTKNDFDLDLYVPNVFTPNGDGQNDQFEIRANSYPENYKITIANRWGNKMFESENINKSWNGKVKNRDCISGTYYYIIKYKSKNGFETKTGFVHLFR